MDQVSQKSATWLQKNGTAGDKAKFGQTGTRTPIDPIQLGIGYTIYLKPAKAPIRYADLILGLCHRRPSFANVPLSPAGPRQCHSMSQTIQDFSPSSTR